SMTLHAGEIVGIYGLMGAGRSEFFDCVMGEHPAMTGAIRLDGEPLTGNGVAARIARGIALIPEDRKTQGLIEIMPIRENMSLSSLRRFVRGFHLDLRREREAVMSFVRDLAIKI